MEQDVYIDGETSPAKFYFVPKKRFWWIGPTKQSEIFALKSLEFP